MEEAGANRWFLVLAFIYQGASLPLFEPQPSSVPEGPPQCHDFFSTMVTMAQNTHGNVTTCLQPGHVARSNTGTPRKGEEVFSDIKQDRIRRVEKVVEKTGAAPLSKKHHPRV